MASDRTILAVFEPGEWYHRDVMRGVFDYRRERTQWRVICAVEEALARAGGAAGIVGFLSTPAAIDRARTALVPAVNFSDGRADRGLSHVVPDNRAVGRLAAEHALAREYAHFAYVGDGRFRWDRLRRDGWEKRLRRQPGATICPMQDVGAEVDELADWLDALPKPVAVFARHDPAAVRLLDACHVAKLTVPDDVAVIGVNNDEVLCESTQPTLSSVRLDCYHLGWTAAQELDRRMAEPVSRCRVIRLPPLGVIERASSAPRISDDPVVARAAAYVRDQVSQPLTATQLAAIVGVGRRTLETRLRRSLGVTPHELIRDARLAQARWLLEHTDLPVHRIAARCGFHDPHYFSHHFHQQTGRPPLAYRTACRRG